MSTLIFLLTFLILVIFFGRITFMLIKGRPVVSLIKWIAAVLSTYTVLWVIFYYLSSNKAVSPGTEICFDDWCATVTGTSRPKTLGSSDRLIQPEGQFIVIQLKMSNNARGIAQKPSEPRVYIIDGKGQKWTYSPRAQTGFEIDHGRQIPFDARLELHQSLETTLGFDIPKEARDLKVLIEEGPFITEFLFREDRQVFVID